MSNFFMYLTILCMLAVLILGIVFIIKWIKRKPKKKIGIATVVVFACVFIFAITGAVLSPSASCEHQFVVESKIEATCLKKGYTSYRCPKCNMTEKKDKTDKLEHSLVKVSVKEATEKDKGEIVYKCSGCKKATTEVLKKLTTTKAVTQPETTKATTTTKKTPSTSAKAKPETTRPPEKTKAPSQKTVDTSVSYEEIYKAYEKNELRADDAYQYKRYRVTAKINSIESGGLFILTGGATLVMETYIDDTMVFFIAEFDKKQEDKLKEVDVGDTITFDGKCLSAGTWTECEIVK